MKSLKRLEKDRKIGDVIIADVRNLFKLKNEIDDTKIKDKKQISKMINTFNTL